MACIIAVPRGADRHSAPKRVRVLFGSGWLSIHSFSCAAHTLRFLPAVLDHQKLPDLPTHQPTNPSQTFRDDDETPSGAAAAQAASTGPRPDNFHCANWTPSARTSWPRRASTMLNVFRVLGMTTFFGAGRGGGGRGALARKRERARTRTRTGLGRAWGRGRLTRHRCDRGFFPSSVHLHSASQDRPAEGAFGLFFFDCAVRPATRARGLTRRRLQSCAGISFKSQLLYLLVYITRYLGMRRPDPTHPPV